MYKFHEEKNIHGKISKKKLAKINLQVSRREKPTRNKIHEKTSARKKFHEKKLVQNNFYEQHQFHNEKRQCARFTKRYIKMQQLPRTKISLQQVPRTKIHTESSMTKISFERRKSIVQISRKEKSVCDRFHEQTSARNIFHE